MISHIVFTGLPERNRKEFRRDVAGTTPELIIKAVCNALDLKRDQLTGPSRKRELVEARYIAIGLIMESVPITLKSVGAMFNRDHSTIIYAKDTYNDLMETNKDFRKKAALVNL